MPAKKQMLEFGPWEPDVAILDGNAAHEAKNVLPSKRGYKPMPSLSASVNVPALPGRGIYARSFYGADGTNLTYACGAIGIFALETDSETGKPTWVRKLSTVSTNICQICKYGTKMYALKAGKLYSADVTGGVTDNFTLVTNSAASGSVPSGECMEVVQDFLVVGAIDGSPSKIHWSAQDDPTKWPSVGTTAATNVQSDVQVFPEGGKVLRIVGGMSSAVSGIVFLEHAVQRMQYVGSPYIFQFAPIDRHIGILSGKSAVVSGNACYYLAEDGFRVTDGDTTKQIGAHRVDEWFFDNCGSSRLRDVVGVNDVKNRVIWWFFASESCAADVYDSCIVYDYNLDRWSHGSVSCEAVFSDYGRTLSLEDLDSYEDEYPGGIDALPFKSLDRVPQGGAPTLAAFSTSHKFCTFTGASMTVTITTQEIGGDRFMLHGLRPLVDCGYCGVKPIYRSRQWDKQSFGKTSYPQRDGVCYQHLSTVYLSAEVTINKNSEWNHAVGVEALVELEGGM